MNNQPDKVMPSEARVVAGKLFRGGERRCDPRPPRVMKAWEECIIHLDDAASFSESRVLPTWGRPFAASSWADEEGHLRLLCADFENGRRIIYRRGARNSTLTFTRTPPAQGSPQ